MTNGETVHGTAVAVNGNGLLILGKEGSGKSSLALDLITMGCQLIADDRVALGVGQGEITLSFPSMANPDMKGVIEARQVGLLSVPFLDKASLKFVLDLDQKTAERMPSPLQWTWAGKKVPLLLRPAHLHPAAIFLALQAGLLPNVDLSSLAHRR